jgi:hypothetical protein
MSLLAKTLVASSALIFNASVLANSDSEKDIKPYYIGIRIGHSNEIDLASSNNSFEASESALSQTFMLGYKWDKHWSAELGTIVAGDLDIFEPADDDIEYSSTYLAVNYTHFPGDKRFFMRARAGLNSWDAEGWDYDSSEFFRNTGISPLLGAELGFEFNRRFEWSLVGIEYVPGGDAQLQALHTGIRFSF